MDADDGRSGSTGGVQDPAAIGRGAPIRLALLGFVILVVALVARWAEDVTAPLVNDGETEMADTVAFESDGGRYRIVTSGPTRPLIQSTVCEVKGGDGEVEQERGADGIDGGHERLGVTRVIEISIRAGRAEVTCGSVRPTGGEGLGRFQIVDGDGPIARGISITLALGAFLLVAGLLWFGAALLRTRATA